LPSKILSKFIKPVFTQHLWNSIFCVSSAWEFRKYRKYTQQI